MRRKVIRIISARKADLVSDKDTATTANGHDWSRADAMTDDDVHAAALQDPDAQPLTDEHLARMRPVPRVMTSRRALG